MVVVRVDRWWLLTLKTFLMPVEVTCSTTSKLGSLLAPTVVPGGLKCASQCARFSE